MADLTMAGPFAVLGWRFGIHAPEPLARHFTTLFAPFVTTGDAPCYRIEETVEPVPTQTTTLDGDLLLTTTYPGYLRELLLADVNARVARSSADDCLLLHGGAVAHGETVVVMPATSGTGKSTLTAALSARGFRYGTDEFVAIDPATQQLQPVPKPISLKPGSWPLLPELAPAIPDDVASYATREWLLPAAQFPDALSPADRLPVDAVVLLQREPDVEATLVELSRARAVVDLAPHSFAWPHAKQRELQRLADFVRGTRCFTLRYDRLDDACDLLTRLACGDNLTGADSNG